MNPSEWQTLGDVETWAYERAQAGDLYVAEDLRRVIAALPERFESIVKEHDQAVEPGSPRDISRVHWYLPLPVAVECLRAAVWEP